MNQQPLNSLLSASFDSVPLVAVVRPVSADALAPLDPVQVPASAELVAPIANGKRAERGSVSPELQTPFVNPCQDFVPIAAPVKEPSPPLQTHFFQEDVLSGYKPLPWHWFYKKEVEKKTIWKPFSLLDSVALEETWVAIEGGTCDDPIVPTDGNRYDVDVLVRQRKSVYWEEPATEVRRCLWFWKDALDTRYTPYNEEFAYRLEEEYRNCMVTNQWHKRLEFPNGESVLLRNASLIVHFPNWSSREIEDFTNATSEGQARPLLVKRGLDGFAIDDGEPPQVDHLVFLVHGIGSVCDLRFRTVFEVVDDFRNLAGQLLTTHFGSSIKSSKINRIEFLPVSWHGTLHGDDTGIDRRLKPITLPSIPKLRHFTNDTLLDILFYTSPIYSETIVLTVGREMNRMYELFLERNPGFIGGVSLGGHSLGSLILFDILAHQSPPSKEDNQTETDDQEIPADCDLSDPTVEELATQLNLEEYLEKFKEEKLGFPELLLCTETDLASLGLPLGPRKRLMTYLRDVETRRAKLKQDAKGSIPTHTSTVSYTVGLAGTGQPSIAYPKLHFYPTAFFALGSPIGMFVTVRGIEQLGADFTLPTCQGFFNIFHPFDPVAYRIETLIDPNLVHLPPVLVPHHKGRKRMHLELRETLGRVGADLRQKFVESLKSTWQTVASLTQFRTSTNAEHKDDYQEGDAYAPDPLVTMAAATNGMYDQVKIGKLNGGRRIDYVLQEAPLESFNEYIFALTSHVGYWESEDTMLLILKETYATMGIFPDRECDIAKCDPDTPLEIPTHSLGFPDPSASRDLFNSVPPAADYMKPAPNGETFRSSVFEFPHTATAKSPSMPVPLFTPSSMTESATSTATAPVNKPLVIGSRPVLEPTKNIVGVDPTAPPAHSGPIAPPPMTGFVKQSVIRR